MPNKQAVVIVGPTAIGKTKLSIFIAKQLSCPILSADSRQLFKELNIGTAKPTKKEMDGIKHYFINSHSIQEDYNVGKFEREAINSLNELFLLHDNVVIVGGSGLYIDAITNGFDDLPAADKSIRNKVEQLYISGGIEALQEKLKELDPPYFNRTDIFNKQRVGRAIEVCLSTGKQYSKLLKGKKKERGFNFVIIGINTNREELYKNINKRVDNMMEDGLLQEVETLIPYKNLNALQTVGYKELFDYFDGKHSLEGAIDKIKQNTRRFAKRQLTWFRRNKTIKWFEPDEQQAVLKYINSCLKTE